MHKQLSFHILWSLNCLNYVQSNPPMAKLEVILNYWNIIECSTVKFMKIITLLRI